MTPGQREAAWDALRSVYGRSSMDADRALVALTDAGFVVLHRDDVTEERRNVLQPLRSLDQPLRPMREARWVGPWTTQETP